MVVDTSVLLAVIFEEKHGSWAAEQLNYYASELLMSTVNLAEFLIRTRDRQPRLADSLEEEIINSGIIFISPDSNQAKIAAQARLKYPLNLGDCFAYALAVSRSTGILTVDSDFRVVDIEVIRPD